MEKFMIPQIKIDPKLLEALREAAVKPIMEEEMKKQRENRVLGMLSNGDPRFDYFN